MPNLWHLAGRFRATAACCFAGTSVTKTGDHTTERMSDAMTQQQLTFGSLFAGIGGLDLGFERAGLACKWQVEIDPYANRVLAKHWPDVRRHDDVRTWPKHDTERVDVICGGFPCTDISSAGKKAGINGEQSGLWSEFARIVCELRPRFVVVENVAALLQRGIGTVLGQLAAIGFDAEWHCISAAAVGAPHLRDRIFIVAHANGERLETTSDFTRSLFEGYREECRERFWERSCLWKSHRSNEGRVRLLPADFDGGDDGGIPDRMDRVRCLGNAVLPQIAEWIGRRIIESAARSESVQ